MKYVVVGQNRETGARMTLEFEAESKAAAERKAAHAGMSVRHVNEAADVPADATGHGGGGGGGGVGTTAPRAYRPVRRRSGAGGLVRLLLLVLIVAALAWYFSPQLRGMLSP